MKLKRLDHVGVIVANLERAQVLLDAGFGLPSVRDIQQINVKARFYRCGDADVELIELVDPAERDIRLGRGREARIEHIAFEVEGVEQTINALARLGISTTGPPQASETYVSVWTRPETSGGVVYQFLEKRR